MVSFVTEATFTLARWRYRNPFVSVPEGPLGTEATMFTNPMAPPAGTVQTSVVASWDTIGHALPPTVTTVVKGSAVPVTVKVVPPERGPSAGLAPVTLNAGGVGVGNGEPTRAGAFSPRGAVPGTSWPIHPGSVARTNTLAPSRKTCRITHSLATAHAGKMKSRLLTNLP